MLLSAWAGVSYACGYQSVAMALVYKPTASNGIVFQSGYIHFNYGSVDCFIAHGIEYHEWLDRGLCHI